MNTSTRTNTAAAIWYSPSISGWAQRRHFPCLLLGHKALMSNWAAYESTDFEGNVILIYHFLPQAFNSQTGEIFKRRADTKEPMGTLAIQSITQTPHSDQTHASCVLWGYQTSPFFSSVRLRNPVSTSHPSFSVSSVCFFKIILQKNIYLFMLFTTANFCVWS